MLKVLLLVIYFAVLIGIGFYCRKNATDVNGFVLGGRSVGPWLTAFAYGTSYFSAVVFVGYAGQFGWKYGISATWAGIGNAIIGSLLASGNSGKKNKNHEPASGFSYHASVLWKAVCIQIPEDRCINYRVYFSDSIYSVTV